MFLTTVMLLTQVELRNGLDFDLHCEGCTHVWGSSQSAHAYTLKCNFARQRSESRSHDRQRGLPVCDICVDRYTNLSTRVPRTHDCTTSSAIPWLEFDRGRDDSRSSGRLHRKLALRSPATTCTISADRLKCRAVNDSKILYQGSNRRYPTTSAPLPPVRPCHKRQRRPQCRPQAASTIGLSRPDAFRMSVECQ